MIVKPELVNKVKNYFNLNIYETKVWLALLSKGVASAGEIAELSGVPRSRTYDVLEGLEKNGFAMQKIGKPVKYFAVKPVAVIEKLKKNMADIAKMNAKLKSLLPKTSIRLGKPMQGQERPSPRVSVEEEKSPATEMERLELELTDIEGKLHKLGR